MMGRAPVRALARAAFVAAVATLGCSGSDRGQVVVGIVTDFASPPLESLSVVVTDTSGQVGDSDVIPLTTNKLPGTYVLSAPTAASVRIQIDGLDSGRNSLATRTAVFTIEPKELLFVRLALLHACTNSPCRDTVTCVEGTCQGVEDVGLQPYTPEAATKLDCSEPTIIDTSTGQPMQDRGIQCPMGQRCVEGTCRP